jgi:myo-inositol-1(or 4)-monophosphatase
MPDAPHALQADWLGACRAAREALDRILRERPTMDQRLEETGTRGEGGDRTLLIDQESEDAIFAELERLHEEGFRFTAVSEERGEVDFGDDAVRVVIDPLDGSLNAKRGLPAHAISLAVAAGTTMRDVVFGYVYDFGAEEEWVARRGEGVLLDGEPLPSAPDDRCDDEGRLEILAIESADPRSVAASAAELGEAAHRLRAFGAIAVSLCQLAATRVDGFATLWRTRAVDVAAAQLIARESGAVVEFLAYDDPLGAPLDLEPHSPLVAARTAEALEKLRGVPVKAALR